MLAPRFPARACGSAVVVTLATFLALAGLLAPAAFADPHGLERQSSHGLAIRSPGPAPGRVVPSGSTHVFADLVSRSGVAAADIYLDGRKLSSRVEKTSGDTSRISATASVTAGEHRLEVHARSGGGGSTVTRTWRFAASGMPVPRLWGQSRVDTAISISQDLYPRARSARAAVIARADDFADALAGAPLAAAENGPLLLSAHRGLSRATGTELERVLPRGARVYLLGGTGALSAKVERDLDARGFTPVRIAGGNRAETARAVAAEVPDSRVAFIVSGHTFPDALSASSPAARDRIPILLTGRDHLSQPTRAYLKGTRVDRVYIVGGTGVVNAAVAEDIDRHAGEVVRLAGGSRYETSARVAHYFYGAADTVAVANGTRFPDALAGGPHAGAKRAPILLSPRHELPTPQIAYVQAKQPQRAFLYGGDGALTDVGTDVRRAALDHGGPLEDDLAPRPGKVVNNLDALQVTFRGAVNTKASSFYVEIDGKEIPGRVTQGDFANTLVFQAGALPFDPKPYTNYPVDVVVAARDSGGTRHLDYRIVLRKLDLSKGDAGTRVRRVQERLTDLGYWLGEPDGRYGTLTVQAVTAFQKVQGLERTGSLDSRTLRAMERAGRPQPRDDRSGRYVEIDKDRQVMFFARDGRVEWTMNTSTGTEDYYYQDGERKLAHTPEGDFTFSRQIDGMRNAPLGQMWRPKYFTSAGHAIHGSTNVPPYPASHGCARLTYPAIDFVWAADLAPIGTPITIY